MGNFDYAFEKTLGLEGGYTNDPTDRGGETNLGITKAVFDSAAQRGIISCSDIKNLTIDQSKAIYKADYWDKIWLDAVTHKGIATEMFDTAVNSGTKKAIVIAQMALDYLGETLDIDGACGPQTLSLINKWCKKDPRALFVALNGIQFIHYVLIVDDKDLIDKLATMVKADAGQTRFARGWTKRIQSYEA
jgi:lysozyme family protein